MSKRYVKSLVAVIVLVILWFAFTGWNKHKSRTEAKKSAAKSSEKILNLAPSHIQSFTLTASDGKTFTCSRQGKTWAITQPEPISADQTKVTSLLQSLTSATHGEQIAQHPSDLKDFGLDPPAETLAVTSDAAPRDFTLLIGGETPTSSGVYAQVAGRPQVFTLTDDVKTSLQKTLFALRDTRAVTLDTEQINRLQVKYGSQSYTLVKNPEGVWEVSLPISVRADHFTVEGLVDGLQSLTMQSIVAEDKKDAAKYGLNHPTLTVDLVTPGGSQSITVGRLAAPGYYAVNSALAPVFTLDESSVSPFQKSAADFRDKNLFSWDMFDVKSFEVTAPDGHWAFQQTDQSKNTWKETAPSAKIASPDDVSAFLSELRSLSASSFPAANPGRMDQFGFNKPAYTFKVTFGAKNQTEVVDVAEANGHVYARRAADPLPSEVSSATLSAIKNTFQKIAK
ncbi:MAG: DUF4340 domain-containing protein [Terriglobia bacterium]